MNDNKNVEVIKIVIHSICTAQVRKAYHYIGYSAVPFWTAAAEISMKVTTHTCKNQ